MRHSFGAEQSVSFENITMWECVKDTLCSLSVYIEKRNGMGYNNDTLLNKIIYMVDASYNWDE